MGAALIGAGAGLLQSGIGFGAASAQRGWEERMANTQYQRGVADMRKAGLNPALMFGSGGPAPTPGVPVADVGGSVGSAMQGLQLSKTLRLLDAQTQQAQNQAFKTMQEGLVTSKDLIEGPDGQSLHEAWLRAATAGLRMGAAQASSAAALNRAALPAAGVEGSKAGGWIRLGGKVVSSAAQLLRGGGMMPNAATGGMSPSQQLDWLTH